MESVPRYSFFQAIEYFSNQSCTRFHDHVYGLLALSRHEISVNYGTARIHLFMSMWAEYLLSWGLLVVAPMDLLKKWDDTTPNGPFDHSVAPFTALGLSCTDHVVYTVALAIATALCGDEAANLFMQVTVLENLALHSMPMNCKNKENNERETTAADITIVDSLENQLQKFCDGYFGIATWEQMTFHGIDDDVAETRTLLEWAKIAVNTAEGIWNCYLQYAVDDSARLIDDDEEWTLIA